MITVFVTAMITVSVTVMITVFGLNKVYSLDIIVHLKQNTKSYTSHTAYMSTALTLNTQNYRHEL